MKWLRSLKSPRGKIEAILSHRLDHYDTIIIGYAHTNTGIAAHIMISHNFPSSVCIIYCYFHFVSGCCALPPPCTLYL